MNRPYDDVINYTRESISTIEQQDKENRQFLDSFTIWIIGFSMGAIALIAGNLDKIKPFLNYWSVKSIILIFTISIISGILHRIFLFYYGREYNGNMMYFKGVMSELNIMEVNPVDVSEITDLVVLIDYLKDDYDTDYKYIVPEIPKMDKELYTSWVIELKRIYKNYNDWAIRDFKIATDFIAEKSKESFGISDKTFKNQSTFNPKNIIWLLRWQNITLYITSGSFILGIILFAVLY